MKDYITGQKLLKMFLSKKGLIAFNLVIFVVAVFSVFDIYKLFSTPTNDSKEIDHILNAIATIFVAYGVALEERESITRIFSIKDAKSDETETKLDHLSHDFGLVFLVIALFVEVTSEIVKIPDLIFNFSMLEPFMSVTGIILTMLMIIKLGSFTIKLAHVERQN